MPFPRIRSRQLPLDNKHRSSTKFADRHAGSDFLNGESANLQNLVRSWISIALLCCSLLLGGNGSAWLDACIELIALIVLFITFSSEARLPRFAIVGQIFLALIVIIPIVQVIPIPITLWRLLPGREFFWTIQSQADATGGYHALSLNPDATRRAALGIIPGAAMFVAALRADMTGRRLLVQIAFGLILISAILGAVQFSTGRLYLYPTPHEGASVGIFVNRNHQADFLNAGIILAAVLARDRIAIRGVQVLVMALMMLLALCVVTTASRMGNILCVFTLLGSTGILFGTRQIRSFWWLGLIVALAVLGSLLLTNNAVIDATLTRFASTETDARFSFWSDTLVAIRQFWIVGSGLGTFVPIYASVENLNAITSMYVNHAHNDYLELILETGLAGVVFIAAYIVMIIVLFWQGVGLRDFPLRVAGLGIILVLLIHSFVDYPLRTFALSTLFGLANALLFGEPSLSSTSRGVRSSKVKARSEGGNDDI